MFLRIIWGGILRKKTAVSKFLERIGKKTAVKNILFIYTQTVSSGRIILYNGARFPPFA